MVAVTKKFITTDLLHIALVLSLLRGDLPYHYRNLIRHRRHNSNFINELDYLNHQENLGPTWGYTQTRHFHNNRFDPPSHFGKSLIDPSSILTENEEEIIEELRRISLTRSNNSPFLHKSAEFQDVTAYLVSGTTNGEIPTQIPALPVLEQTEEGNIVAAAISENVEHDDEILTSTPNDSDDQELPFLLEDLELSSNSCESRINDVNNGDLNESVAVVEVETFWEPVDIDIDLNIDLQSNAEQEELLEILKLQNQVEQEGTTRAEEIRELERQTSTSPDLALFSHNLNDEVEDGEEYYRDLEAIDELYRLYEQGFGDDVLEENLEAIPPMAIHNQEFYDEGIENEGRNRNRDSEEESDEASSVIPHSSHDDPASKPIDETAGSDLETATIDDLFEDSILDTEELWETDSGVFDSFFEGDSPDSSRLTFEDSGRQPEAALKSETADEIQSSSNEDSRLGSSSAVPDGPNSIEMLQTAPIHASARPTSHAGQPSRIQVHAPMPGLLRGSMNRDRTLDQRWPPELTNIFGFQTPHDPTGVPSALQHHFGPHHHSHLHHPPHHQLHHSIHHPPFSSAPSAPSHYNHESARSVLLQNATLAQGDLNSTTAYPNVGMGPPPNIGSAVSSSMHLTNSSEPMIDPSLHFKMIEPSHDMLYYPNTSSSEMSNQTTEGFLSSILNLNDEDLLMDMAMNEGMYTMKSMVDNSGGTSGVVPSNLPHPSNCNIGNGTVNGAGASAAEDRLEASSDSAVSSMGSERVPPMTDPPISDNEWAEQDSHQNGNPYSLDYSHVKLRGYDYYGKVDGHRGGAPVAQKKHHMFGKRFQAEQGSIHPYGIVHHQPGAGLHLPYTGHGLQQGSSLEPLEMKYSCSVDFVRHHNDVRGGVPGPEGVHSNHTYALPPSHSENAPSIAQLRTPRSGQGGKDKPKKEHLSRDEKRARAMSLPMTTDDIINLPMDEFNERLSKYDLSEAQLSLIRDIRRRGKNKVAAQNCRKRKLDQILQLADEVNKIRERKQSLIREEQSLINRRNHLKERYGILYKAVFSALRDADGNPYHMKNYSLQQAADGNIILVPHCPLGQNEEGDPMDPTSSRRAGKSKED